MTEPPKQGTRNDLAARAAEVMTAASKAGFRIATAESCTGGMLATLLTDVEGASHAFECGFVSYSEDSKCNLLGVARADVERYDAVSQQVATAMAKGALHRSKADIAVAITGYAGPGDEDSESGLVHLACVHGAGAVRHREKHFGNIGRDAVRDAAVGEALAMLREIVAAPAG